MIQYNPKWEYYRICPYCYREFIADHLSRKFCKSRDGVEELCKERYKRVKKERKTGDTDFEATPEIQRNVQYLKFLLNGDDRKIVEKKVLDRLHYDFGTFSGKIPSAEEKYSVCVEEFLLKHRATSMKGIFFLIVDLNQISKQKSIRTQIEYPK